MDMVRIAVWPDGHHDLANGALERNPERGDDFRVIAIPEYMLDTDECEEIAAMAANGAPDDVLDSCIAHMIGG